MQRIMHFIRRFSVLVTENHGGGRRDADAPAPLCIMQTLLVMGVAFTLPSRPWQERPTSNTGQAVSWPTSSTGQAVSRLIQVECVRLADTVRVAKPAPALETIKYWTETRGPLLHWGLTRLVEQTIGQIEPLMSQQDRGALPRQPRVRRVLPAPLASPNLGDALLMLTPQIKAELSVGLRTAPLRVIRLAFRTAQLTGYGFLARRFPDQLRGRRPSSWLVRFLDHAATTLEDVHVEKEHRRLLVRASIPASRSSSSILTIRSSRSTSSSCTSGTSADEVVTGPTTQLARSIDRSRTKGCRFIPVPSAHPMSGRPDRL